MSAETANGDAAAAQAQQDRVGRRAAVSGLKYSELPPGDTWTGPPRDLQAGDYLQASVHGYSLVKSVHHAEGTNVSHIQFASGGSESGYPYGRAIHRPDLNKSSKDYHQSNENYGSQK